MAKRAAVAFLAIAPPIILLASFAGSAVGDVLFALLAAVFPVALAVLGAQRGGRLGWLLGPLAGLALILVACTVAMLALRGRILDGPWLGGLPTPAAVLVYGLFALPLVLVPLAYALTFDRLGLREQDLAELRRRFGGRGDG